MDRSLLITPADESEDWDDGEDEFDPASAAGLAPDQATS
jgi:hypothetical protein